MFEESVLPIIEAGLADLVNWDDAIGPGIHARPEPGYTLGHSILSVATDAGKIRFTGDAFHHPLQIVDPTLHLAAVTISRSPSPRGSACSDLAERHSLMIPVHFAEPMAATL